MTNKTLTPDQLKRVAEYIWFPCGVPEYGMNATTIEDGKVFLFVDGFGDFEYDPENIAEQSMELLKMLLDKGWELFGTDNNPYVLCWARENKQQIQIEDESLEQAILLATWESIKDKDND